MYRPIGELLNPLPGGRIMRFLLALTVVAASLLGAVLAQRPAESPSPDRAAEPWMFI